MKFTIDTSITNKITEFTQNTHAYLRSFGPAKHAQLALRRKDDDVSKTASYLRVNGAWIKFYLGNNSGEFIQNSDLGDGLKGFPAKCRRMILLKDIVRNQYSNNGEEVFKLARPLLEASFNYTATPLIETNSYSSDYVSEEFAYTPIPAIFGGFAHYRLSVNEEKIDFKEIATRQVLSWHI